MEELIYKFALQNAIKFKGKANVGAVIGKVIAKNPSLNRKELAQKVQGVIKKVNSMTLKEQLEELKKIDPELLEKKEHKEKDLFAFLNIKKGTKIRTAFPPGPEKYPHIGHSKALLVNYELAKKFKGKFILRFEDTNPKLVKKEFYDIMIDNFHWLGAKWDKLEYASDYMEKFYELGKKLIEGGEAYACKCTQDEMKERRFKRKECKCRNNNTKKNLELFNLMPKMEEGECVIRMKIDMKHKNTTMRDPILFRIIKHPHARHGDKYSVWPSYDFQNSVMDGIEKITHRLRSKEFEMRNELQRYIQKKLGFQETKIYEFARFQLEGVETSGRKIREQIENKELIGWDDPSLATLVALKRRGFHPKAIKEFVMSTGLNKTESTLTWDDLIVHNRRILDKVAKRFFMVEGNKILKIKDAPSKKIEIPLHPDDPNKGIRKFETEEEFYIEDKIEPGKVYRLMHLFNFKDGKFLSEEYDPKLKAKIIHWLPVNGNLIEVEILNPDKTITKGKAEETIKNLKEGEVCQFERKFFARLDIKENFKFWFTHK